MILTLPANRPNITARCFGTAIVVIILYLLIRYGLHDPANDRRIGPVKARWLLYFLTALMAFAFVLTIHSLSGITNVTVDTLTGTIALHSLLQRNATIATSDIDHYFTTRTFTRYKIFEGLILQLRSGRSIQLIGQNLLSINDFRDYLENKKVPFKGSKKLSFPFR